MAALRSNCLTLISIIFITTAAPAVADPYLIASSVKNKVTIVAPGGDVWCAPQIALQFNLDPGSPLIKDTAQQIAMMDKISSYLTAQCPQGVSANVVVQDMSGPTPMVLGKYTADASSHWQFTAAVTPAPPATTTAIKSLLAAAAPLPVVAASPAPPATLVPALPVVVPAPMLAAVPPSFILPKYINFQAVMLAYLRDNPTAQSDPAVIAWWTWTTFPDLYQQLRGQEFKLQPLLQQGQSNLMQTLQQWDGSVVIILSVRLDPYDFNKNQYPLNIQPVINVSQGYALAPSPVNNFRITFDSKNLPGIPIAQKAAAAYEAAETDRYGNMDRSVEIAIKLKLAPGSLANQSVYSAAANATIDSVAMYAAPDVYHRNDPTHETPVVVIGPDQIAAFRKAEDQAALSAAQAQMTIQRSANIQTVSQYNQDQKLYNWLNPGPLTSSSLDNIRSARERSVVYGQTVNVTMLVKTNNGGRNAETSWPGHLALTSSATVPAFSSGSWYLVSGALLASTKPGDLSSTLTVATSYQCNKAQCAEALSPEALVDHRNAILNH